MNAPDQPDPSSPVAHRHDQSGSVRATGDFSDYDKTLGLMAKYWTVGEVKTRLGASIGMDSAASMHRLFTSYLCSNLAECGHRRELCFAPDDCVGPFRDWLEQASLNDFWNPVPQGIGDLGQRMSRWFARHLCYQRSTRSSHSSHQPQQEPPATILIGADCPTLSQRDIEHAFDQLQEHEIVIGPAADGGYYLIGLRGAWDDRFASLFQEIPWSTADVLPTTCQRANDCGFSLVMLETAEDVDTIVELDRLQNRLRQTESHVALRKEVDQILAASSPSHQKAE